MTGGKQPPAQPLPDHRRAACPEASGRRGDRPRPTHRDGGASGGGHRRSHRGTPPFRERLLRRPTLWWAVGGGGVAEVSQTVWELRPGEDSRPRRPREGWGMGYIAGADPAQTLLLPEAVEDYVDGANPVRFSSPRRRARSGWVWLRSGGDGGHRAARLRADRSAEALHLRLPQPGPLEPTPRGRGASQHRGDLAHPGPASELRDDRRRPAREPGRLPRCIPGVRGPVPRARPVRPRAPRGGRHADEGREQQGPQLHARSAGEVYPRGGREAGRVHGAARCGRRPGGAGRQGRRRPRCRQAGREDRRHRCPARPAPGAAGRARPRRRGPDLAGPVPMPGPWRG